MREHAWPTVACASVLLAWPTRRAMALFRERPDTSGSRPATARASRTPATRSQARS